jgi:ankyrin repeat protein
MTMSKNSAIPNAMFSVMAFIVALLVHSGGYEVQAQKSSGLSASDELHHAAGAGDVQRMREALRLGADVNCCKDYGAGPPLVRAAFLGKLEAVRFLLDNGADPNIQDKDGMTALHQAVRLCNAPEHQKVVALLLERGANINIPDNRGYSVWTGAYLTKPGAFLLCKPVRAMLFQCSQKQGRFGPRPDSDYQKIIHGAWRDKGISGKALDEIDFVLAAGADVNCCADYGKGTPLMEAAFYNDYEAVAFLIERGAAVNLQSRQDGGTALHRVVHNCFHPQSVRVLKLLLEKGGDIHAQDNEGRTPLDFWTRTTPQHPCPEIKRVLLEHGQQQRSP